MQKTLKKFVLLAGVAVLLAGCNVPLIPLI